MKQRGARRIHDDREQKMEETSGKLSSHSSAHYIATSSPAALILGEKRKSFRVGFTRVGVCHIFWQATENREGTGRTTKRAN